MVAAHKMVTTIFRDSSKAQEVVDWLVGHGHALSDISVLMSEQTRVFSRPEGGGEPLKPTTKAVEGMGIGGAIGTAAGASLAAIAAIGTSLALPGIGVVAGPLAAAFAGGGAGALAGGVIGGLVGLGISESNVEAYEKALKEGGVVIGVQPRSDEDCADIMHYFEKLGGENIVAC